MTADAHARCFHCKELFPFTIGPDRFYPSAKKWWQFWKPDAPRAMIPRSVRTRYERCAHCYRWNKFDTDIPGPAPIMVYDMG